VAIGPDEQRQPPMVDSVGPQLDCVSSGLSRHRCSA
jgi:hypothetical protein